MPIAMKPRMASCSRMFRTFRSSMKCGIATLRMTVSTSAAIAVARLVLPALDLGTRSANAPVEVELASRVTMSRVSRRRFVSRTGVEARPSLHRSTRPLLPLPGVVVIDAGFIQRAFERPDRNLGDLVAGHAVEFLAEGLRPEAPER